MLLLFSRGVNFQYVWREFWECDGCASSQLVRSNILQALFAAPLFKAFAQIDGLSECETLTRDSQASVAALLFDSSMKVEEEGRYSSNEGHQPLHQRACVFKAKPASKIVRALAMKKLKEALN